MADPPRGYYYRNVPVEPELLGQLRDFGHEISAVGVYGEDVFGDGDGERTAGGDRVFDGDPRTVFVVILVDEEGFASRPRDHEREGRDQCGLVVRLRLGRGGDGEVHHAPAGSTLMMSGDVDALFILRLGESRIVIVSDMGGPAAGPPVVELLGRLDPRMFQGGYDLACMCSGIGIRPTPAG
jgi:hypothetical protein